MAAATAVPTMSNPACGQVDSAPVSVPSGTVGLFEGAHYYTAAPTVPSTTARCATSACRFAASAARPSGTASALTALAARPRTPSSVVARFPEHLTLAVADDGRAMTNWWNPSG